MPLMDNTIPNKSGITVRGITELVEETLEDREAELLEEQRREEEFKRSLAGHISSCYQVNKRARRESGIEKEMLDSLLQVNMEYTADEKAMIRQANSSDIYMGLTATKARAAKSWLKDIIQPANETPYRIEPTPVADIPKGILKTIESAFEEDKNRISESIDKEYMEATQPSKEGEVPSTSALLATKKLRKTAELKRDIREAVLNEINKLAKAEVQNIALKVQDELVEGYWDLALSDFIEDFTIFPTAFIKGPIVNTSYKLVWEKGIAKKRLVKTYKNKRISPFDCYPSPSAKSIYDGNFCEHIRLTRKELSDLSKLSIKEGYKPESIKELLSNPVGSSSSWIDSDIEEDKAIQEKRGNSNYASEGIYHGVHFWGTATAKMLRSWGVSDESLINTEDYEEIEIEAILINDTVIKCIINTDPLLRRPYYCASFQNRSGSIWGKSLPSLMKDIQRLCNSCARALADNMGLSSGPQVAVMIDRLADSGDIEDIYPKKIWQFTSDPTGNSGRPIEVFEIPSNATELISVYDRFEPKADDVTGVPRYAYGNENVGGAGQTASGLSMLLESASKGIRASIKNISEGVIIPRVEYQFYLHLLKEFENNNPVNFSGDINVVVHAVEAITIKAAEAQLQAELLQATANPYDMEIIGMVGRGDVLRKVFKGANMPEDAIPSRLVLKDKQKQKEIEQQKNQALQQKAEQDKQRASLEATNMQITGQERMNNLSQQVKMLLKEKDEASKEKDRKLEETKILLKAQDSANKAASDNRKIDADKEALNKKLAVDLTKR